MTARESASTEPLVTVHVPHTAGLPPLRPYFRELWRRRRFAFEMARTELKARHFDTVFGQVWTVLNPLFLALVYFLLFGVILQSGRGNIEFLSFLLLGLFAFYYTRNCLGTGANAIVSGGGLIMNTAFPRALLPLSSVLSGLLMYLPTLAVYAVFHLIARHPNEPVLLLLPLLIVVQTVLNFGLAMVASAATVYFRDTSAFLPYFLRIWLYLSPVLYRIEEVPDAVQPFLWLNPLTSLLSAMHAIVLDGEMPAASTLFTAVAWALGMLIFGGWFFLSRERDFATRL